MNPLKAVVMRAAAKGFELTGNYSAAASCLKSALYEFSTARGYVILGSIYEKYAEELHKSGKKKEERAARSDAHNAFDSAYNLMSPLRPGRSTIHRRASRNYRAYLEMSAVQPSGEAAAEKLLELDATDDPGRKSQVTETKS